MATAQQMLKEKGDTVYTVEPDATVLVAAQKMNEHHVGSLVVTKDGRLAGIFTERDILRRVVGEGRDPEKTTVGEVMTTAVACAAPETTLDEMKHVMREKRIRHLPVVVDGQVIGMVSIGDLNRAENSVQAQTIRYLEQYMSVS